jgi:hypothetical protein
MTSLRENDDGDDDEQSSLLCCREPVGIGECVVVGTSRKRDGGHGTTSHHSLYGPRFGIIPSDQAVEWQWWYGGRPVGRPRGVKYCHVH